MIFKDRSPKWLLPAFTAALTIAIFVFDTKTEVEIAAAVFYVVVVLLSMSFCRGRSIVYIAGGCMLLTILSYAIDAAWAARVGIINCCISLSAIAITAYLALKIDQAQTSTLQAQAQLAHASRIIVLGELTTSIAHEINQPLAAIVSSGEAAVRWLGMNPPTLEKASKAVERMIGDANRASTIIARVRTLARRAPTTMKVLDIADVVAEAVELSRREIDAKGIVLRVEVEDKLPRVCGDTVQLQQVILNLIINAGESIIAAAGATAEIAVIAARHGPREIVISVRDSGTGFGGSDLEEIFEPFITTKGGGLGIGLTISRSIIQAHRGRIWATSNDTRGATLQFVLPAG